MVGLGVEKPAWQGAIAGVKKNWVSRHQASRDWAAGAAGESPGPEGSRGEGDEHAGISQPGPRARTGCCGPWGLCR